MSLGLTLIVLAPTLSFLTGFYLRYINTNSNSLHHENHPVISFDSVLFNCAFLLSHLTNQGTKSQLIILN